MKVNYHTHTYRCGHASGKDEEYVLAAIDEGYTKLGFSDHVFIPGLDQDKGMRGNYDELDDYIGSIRSLKVKYRSQIEILVGFECEYFPELEEYYRKLLKTKVVDYLILGQHFVKYDGHRISGYILSHSASVDAYATYIEQALKTGLFSVLVHPDLYLGGYGDWDPYAYEIANRVCKAAKENHVYLEFNQGAMRRGKHLVGNETRYLYPVKQFWEVAKLHQNQVIMGVDAHHPNDFKHMVNLEIAPNLAKEWGVRLVEDIQLKKVS